MAQNLQLLKRRIKTSKNIAQIAKALEMIAAAKIKKVQVISQNNKPYADAITKLTQKVISSKKDDKYTHPYLTQRNASKNLLIVISPDRGLSGSLNTNIYKKMIEVDSPDTKVVTVGKKAAYFASRLRFELLLAYPMGNTTPDYSMVYQLKTIIDDEIENSSVSKVSILYPDFISLFTQTPTIQQLLPLEIERVENENSEDPALLEPGRRKILEELLPYYLEVQLYNTLLASFTSLQAAQMVAMQNAKNNAFDIAEYLNLVYNKSRQERITNEILDLSNSIQI
jgi:F-type H+-transporting ATPase subunit gamma